MIRTTQASPLSADDVRAQPRHDVRHAPRLNQAHHFVGRQTQPHRTGCPAGQRCPARYGGIRRNSRRAITAPLFDDRCTPTSRAVLSRGAKRMGTSTYTHIYTDTCTDTCTYVYAYTSTHTQNTTHLHLYTYAARQLYIYACGVGQAEHIRTSYRPGRLRRAMWGAGGKRVRYSKRYISLENTRLVQNNQRHVGNCSLTLGGGGSCEEHVRA